MEFTSITEFTFMEDQLSQLFPIQKRRISRLLLSCFKILTIQVSVEHGQVSDFEKVKGIIGAFMNNNAYFVAPNDDGSASVIIGYSF